MGRHEAEVWIWQKQWRLREWKVRAQEWKLAGQEGNLERVLCPVRLFELLECLDSMVFRMVSALAEMELASG